MWIQKKISKEDILEVFVKEMENLGITRDRFTLNINQINERIKSKNRKDTNVDELRSLLGKLLANEWLENPLLDGDAYSITLKGLGIIKSRLKNEKLSLLKKISDFFENHKGLFIPLSALSGIVALISIVKIIADFFLKINL